MGAPGDAPLEFLSAVGISFDVAPEAAIGFFRQKGLQTSFAWQDMIGEEHEKAFTVAKMLDVDLLAAVRDKLDDAIAKGQTFRRFKEEIIPTLQAAGWWGRQTVQDPLTGQVKAALLGSPGRLKTIFRTNLQTSYAAGQWSKIREQSLQAPYLLYEAVDDHRTRPAHAALDGLVLEVGDPFWETHYPPNGYNCRCTVIQLSARQLKALGKDGPDKAPAIDSYTWTNPRTGDTFEIPVGLDPGWDYHPGKAALGTLQQVLAAKVRALPSGMKEAAAVWLAQRADKILADAATGALPPDALLAQAGSTTLGPVGDAMAAVQAAIGGVSATKLAKAKAALKGAVAEAKAKNLLAKLSANAGIKTVGGKPKGIPGTDPAGWKTAALKKLAAGGELDGLTALEQITKIEALAPQLQAAHASSTKLSQYKKAILAGKLPPPAAAQAFDALDDAAKAKFLQKLEAEKTAIAAAEKAKAEAEALAQAQAAAQAATEAQAKAAAEAAAKAAAAAQVGASPPVVAPTFADLIQIGPQRGSNVGGLFQDRTTGKQWYVKIPTSEDVARNEVLAAKLYQAAGVEVPEVVLLGDATIGGRSGFAIASEIVEGLTQGKPAALAKAAGALEGFAADAWLANWDVVGLGFDNLLLKAGRAIRVDTGGALRYRAQGGLKGAAWGDTVTELDSLRSSGVNAQAAAVFGKIPTPALEAGVARVLAIGDDEIRRLVREYGPRAPGEQAALADRLIARRKDLAGRFPHLAAPPPVAPLVEPPAARVTAEEVRRIAAARQNGYVIGTDLDQVEDQSLLFWHELDRQGNPRTMVLGKVREQGAATLQKLTKAAGAAPDVFEDGGVFDATLAAVKGIATNATVRAVDLQRVGDAVKRFGDALAAAQARVAAGELPQAALDQYEAQIRPWIQAVKTAVAGGEGSATAWTPPPGQLAAFKWPKLKIKAAAAAQGVQFRKVQHTYQFRQIVNGNAQEAQGPTWRAFDAYEAEIDGVTVRYFGPDAPFALRDRIEFEVPGNDAGAAARAYAALERLGVDTSRPTPEAVEGLYLAQIANHMNRLPAYQAAIAGAASDAERIAKGRAWLAQETGRDPATMPLYRPDGQRQAFDTGHVHRYRPDLEGPEWSRFEKDYRLIHEITGGKSIEDAIREVLNSGGMLAPTADKLRRGIPVAGMSPGADLDTGGASYFFTRIRSASSATATAGLVWKARHLGRLDAISYSGDMFGRVTGNTVATYRRTGVGEWREAARSGSNETIFKNGLSIFDDLEAIVTHSEAERQRVIKRFTDAKITAWPDGRSLEDVVIGPTPRKRR